jgi:bifunctional non-homologous end joining protein LigD
VKPPRARWHAGAVRAHPGAVRAPTIEPMLAGYGMPGGSLSRWAAEPKLDGWRAHVTVSSGTVAVRSRRGRPLEVPELAPLLDIAVDVVLDGELVAGGGRMEDFYGLAPALARRRRHVALTFAAFDVLWIDGRLTMSLAYDDRRRLLEQLDLPRPATVVPQWAGDDATVLLDACEAHDVEGVVLKRRDSDYRPGQRSSTWRKVKCSTWRSVHLERRMPERLR